MSTIKIQWNLIKSYLLPILYYMIIASIMTIQSSSIIFSALLAATLMAMKLTSLPFEVDTNEKLDKFYGSLPVSKIDLISSRYGLMIIIGFIGIIKVRLFSIIPVIFYILGASLYIYTDISNNLIEIIDYLKNNIWATIISILLVSVLVGYISFTISKNIVKKKE